MYRPSINYVATFAAFTLTGFSVYSALTHVEPRVPEQAIRPAAKGAETRTETVTPDPSYTVPGDSVLHPLDRVSSGGARALPVKLASLPKTSAGVVASVPSPALPPKVGENGTSPVLDCYLVHLKGGTLEEMNVCGPLEAIDETTAGEIGAPGEVVESAPVEEPTPIEESSPIEEEPVKEEVPGVVEAVEPTE